MNDDLSVALNNPKPMAVNAAGDDRVINNSLRHQYRVLSEAEKALMVHIKDQGQILLDLLGEINLHAANSGREISIAKTKLEEAVMWAVKGLTK